MKFGISTFVTDKGIGPAELGAAVEQRGFDSLFVPEHSHIPASRDSPYPMGGDLPEPYYRSLDPFVALTAAAGATERLVLGTGVALLVQRDVIHTAKEIASLDLVSGGRAVLGVAVGWNREEMLQHGTDPRSRGALLNEQLVALKVLWRDEKAEFHGRHVDFESSYQWPKPVQDPHPPIYVGGNGPAAVRRAVEHGDTWMPNAVADPAQIAGQLALLDEHPQASVSVTATSAGTDQRVLEGYIEAGLERVTLALPNASRDDALRALDRLAETIQRLR